MSRIKTLLGFGVAIILIIAVIGGLGHIVRPTKTDKSIDAINNFHSLPQNSLEVIGYGSSHMWRSLVPKVLYEKYGIGAYNYGCNWQHINTTELFIKDSLLTQSPKLILIETYNVNKVLQDTNIVGEIYYTRAIPNFEGKKTYLRQCFGNDKERYLSYFVPLCAFHENWVNLTEESFMVDCNTIDFNQTMGYEYTDEVKKVEIGDASKFEQLKLDEDAIKVLNEIVDICNKKNIDILFFTTPWQGEYAYSDAMEKYAREKGCTYLNLFDYMDEMGIDCETDFKDEGHFNYKGAVKASEFLGDYIKKHYKLTDMRMVEGNIWEDNFKNNYQ